METRALGERASLLFFRLFCFSFGKLKCFTVFCWASDHCQQYSAASSDFPAPTARARTHTSLELGSCKASGKVGAAGAPTATQAEAVAGASRCSAEGPLRDQERACFRSTARGVDAKESEGDPGLGTVSLRRLATKGKKKKKFAELYCLYSCYRGLRKPQTHHFGSAEEKDREGEIPEMISDCSEFLFRLQIMTFGNFSRARMDTQQRHVTHKGCCCCLYFLFWGV